jgi:hypothetical protein
MLDGKPCPKLIVRLRTSIWHDSRGAYLRREIKWLIRKSEGFNFFEEDCSMAGADEVVPKILNLNECKDGLYKLDTCNESRDWETGYIDDYDYKLIPVTL